MRAGTDTALARVVKVFGAAHPHQAYLFAQPQFDLFGCNNRSLISSRLKPTGNDNRCDRFRLL
jgi:hypothetical protein